MTIRETEGSTGLDRATIRFYEREGLLSPRRLENGYRDYSEEDRQGLLRIKLLRELGVSLEEIRALQQGTAALPQTLAARLEALEREMAASSEAQETCRAIRDEGVSYQDLDAEKYLKRTAGIPAPVRDAPPPSYCPWRRLYARAVDESIYTLFLGTILALGFHVNLGSGSQLLFLVMVFLPLALMLAVEPLLLHLFGTTPGKALFGIRVERQDGSRLSYAEAQIRTGKLIWQGMGWGIPFYQYYRQYKSYQIHKAGQELPWDVEADCRFEIGENCWFRNAASVCILIMIGGLYGAVMFAAGFPPHYGALTPEAYVENYNFLSSYYGDSVYRLDETGHWEKRDPLTVVIDPWALEDPKVEFQLDDAGYVTAATVRWKYLGAGIVAPPVEEMRYLALAYGAGTGGWWDYASRLWERWFAFSGALIFGGFSKTVGNLDLQCTVEQTGFLTSDTTLIQEEDGDTYCAITFSVQSA